MESESLVIIRTFPDLASADEAQVTLMAAGVYALVVADDAVQITARPGQGRRVALAVHRRDVGLAENALAPRVATP